MSPLTRDEDPAGVSALAWDPSSNRGIHFVGAGQSDVSTFFTRVSLALLMLSVC